MARDRPTRRLDEPAPEAPPVEEAPPAAEPLHPFDPALENDRPLDLGSSTRRLEERQAVWFTRRERWIPPTPPASEPEASEPDAGG
jgi:hypothetical protein